MILVNSKRFCCCAKLAIVAAAFTALAGCSSLPVWAAEEAAKSKAADSASDQSTASRKNKHDVGLSGHGFVRDASSNFTTIDFPGAVVTAVIGINECGQMIGEYLDPNGGDHGFLLDNGVVTTIDAPGATFVVLHDISNDGVIVGEAVDDTRNRGFVWKDGTFTPLSAPGAFFWSFPVDIDGRGRIVGFYF